MNSFFKNPFYEQLVKKMLNKYGYRIEITQIELSKQLNVSKSVLCKIFKQLRAAGLMTDEYINGARKIYVISRSIDKYLQHDLMDKNKKELHQADKSVYVDSAKYGGSTNDAPNINIDTWYSLAKYNLSGKEIFILAVIWFQYVRQASINHGNYQPIMLSYQDIADIALCSPCGAKKAIKQLIKHNLIIQSRCGEGRTKSGYSPNIDELRNSTKLYIKTHTVIM